MERSPHFHAPFSCCAFIHHHTHTHTHTHTDTEDAARFFSLKRLSCDTWSEMKMVSKLIQQASSDLVYESKSIIHQEVVLKRKKKRQEKDWKMILSWNHHIA